ncbi:MAG: zf-HC2 domain-containing protein [Gemmatimonadota bacterium]
MREANGHVEELLDRYRTGELGAADRRRVKAHLEECEGCRSALAALDDFSETVERAYAAETTARAAEREPDWGRLRASIVARTTARGSAPRRSWLARHVPQTAALVVALVALGVLWQQEIRGPADAGRALRSERPVASSDRDAMPADRSTDTPSLPGVAESETTAGAELDRARTATVDESRRTNRDAAESPGEGLDDRAGAGERPTATREAAPVDALELEDEAAAAPQAGAAMQKADTPADSNDLERFELRARGALAEKDLELAETALTQWRDSLASGDELPADLRRAAEALADSLAAFLATRP